MKTKTNTLYRRKIGLGMGLLSLFVGLLSLTMPDNTATFAPYLNGIFSERAPGDAGSWTVEDAYPQVNIPSPLRMLSLPNTNDYLVLSKIGEIWQLSLETQAKRLVLDIKDRSFKLGEAGTVGMALHPQFGDVNAPDKQLIFVFYRHKPNPDEWDEIGFNRLSKFTWNSNTQTFDADSEEILIQQYDRSTWHNGGGMFFGKDGFLYLALGDEGADEYKAVSTQRLDGGLFSGLIRIDVDNNPAVSHPIIRQPIANATPPDGWGTTFSQGYSIPNDNPWLSSEGDYLEEFYAVGIRSPYSTVYDPMDEQIWVLDVGSDVREEMNILKKADNLQWPYKEGSQDSESFTKPSPLIGNERTPLFEYDRSVGSAVIGGGVYRGPMFTSLYGKYLFADYVTAKLMALNFENINDIYFETLIPNLTNLSIDLPEKPGITGVHILDDGNILLTVVSGEDFTQPGKILRLRQTEVLPDPPQYLSALGVFKNLETLEVEEGILPYTVNSPLWSDRAKKRRWMAIPHQETIEFKNFGNWIFPEGTVFIKHFDLPLTTDPDGPLTKLETRFFIVGKNGNAYGLTYQWNEEGTDAELLRVGDAKEFDITEGGEVVFTQRWDYPSRDQCLSCHNQNANYVLGVKTHQLNGDLFYDDMGISMNQLEFLSDKGLLSRSIDDATSLNKAYPIDDENIDLELRIRSYLDANCASCHRLGGVSTVNMDLRYEIPLQLQNTINFEPQSLASDPDNFLIKPGDHTASELWQRDNSMDDNRMPPLSRNLKDETYLVYLAEWIDNLSEDSGDNTEFFLFPNPADEWLYVRFSDDWLLPVDIDIYNSNGQIVYQVSNETSVFYIDIHHLKTGAYILKARSGEDSLVKRFLVI